MTTWLKTDHDIVGPDVSIYQGMVDWATMAARQTNMGFAMCKATQGTTHVDSQFKTNLLAMNQHLSTTSRTFPPPTPTSPYTHPIAIGVYHFANIIPGQTDADYAQQADFFFNTAHNVTSVTVTVTPNYTHASPSTTTITTPTSTTTTTITSKHKTVTVTVRVHPDFWVLDWEDARGHSLSVTERAKFAKTFVTRLYNNLKSKFGSSYVPKIFIYVGYYYWGNPDVNVVGNVYEWFGSYGPKLWIAAYVTKNVLPPVQGDWDVVYNDPTLNVPHFAPPHPPHPPHPLPPPTWSAWQYTSSARVPGVSGRCDVSVVLSPEVWNSDFYQPP
jgi:GH25 family lysozyme M1 (1,4-beta-N-acetylmuramidase)